MSKNIARNFGYTEGPYIVTFYELSDGTLEACYDHRTNYTKNRKIKRDYEGKKSLNRYSKYNNQIRTTDVWNMYD